MNTLISATEQAERWLVRYQVEQGEPPKLDPGKTTEMFQAIKIFALGLETLERKEPDNPDESLEWKITITALKEIAEMMTSVMREIAEERFKTCYIICRPMTELAETLWYATKEDELIGWYEYSIRKDQEDLGRLRATDEKDETSREKLSVIRNELKKKEATEEDLGPRHSGMDWKDLKNKWQPKEEDLLRRLNQEEDGESLQELHLLNSMVSNGYIHARSRAFDPEPNHEAVILGLALGSKLTEMAGKELIKKFRLGPMERQD